MRRTLVVGSINMDIVNRVRSHPRPGETIPGLGVSYFPGGKGANQAVAAAQSGGQVRMFGAVGSDAFADSLQTNLGVNGVDTAFVQRVPGSSGLAFITVDAAGENSIIIDPGANGQLTTATLTTVAEALFDGVDTLVVQNEIPSQVTRLAMELAHSHGVQVIFNPAPVAGVTLDWLKHVDVVVVNETEAEALTQVRFDTARTVWKAAREAAAILLAAGAGTAVITLGSRGSLCACVPDAGTGGIQYLEQPAFKVVVVDTTAAGDTFVGALAAKLAAAEADWPGALKFASAASALAVGKPGAQASVPAESDVLAFLAEQA